MSENESCCCAPSESSSDCCCGDGGSEGCCDGAYSCADEPYRGRKKTVVLDFLYLDLNTCDRCMGADERVALAVERCRPILAACGYNLVLNMVEVEDAQLAEHYRFYSSPTVRVNGVDICPSIEENDCDCCSDIAGGVSVKCRIFPFNGTYYEVPPTDMLVRGIMETVICGEKAHPELDPYELPQNLADFFEGKQREQQRRAEGGAPAEPEPKCCCC